MPRTLALVFLTLSTQVADTPEVRNKNSCSIYQYSIVMAAFNLGLHVYRYGCRSDSRVIDDSLYLERNVPTSRLVRNSNITFVAYLNSYNLCNLSVPRFNFLPGFLRGHRTYLYSDMVIPKGPLRIQTFLNPRKISKIKRKQANGVHFWPHRASGIMPSLHALKISTTTESEHNPV